MIFPVLFCILGSNFLLFASCALFCHGNEFYDSKSATCRPCDPSCATCKGPLANHCLACVDDLKLHNGWCSCQYNQYFDVQPKKCKNCHPKCTQTCTGPSQSGCSSCSADEFSFQGLCFSKCRTSEYFDKNSLSCKPCASNCSTCFGSARNECTSCAVNYLLNQGRCIDQCLAGNFLVQEGLCSSCNSNCSTCSGPSETECLSCSSGKILVQGKCVTNNSTNICHDSCEYCVDISEQGCKSCKSGFFFLENQQGQGSCLTTCPIGYIKTNMSNQNMCQICPSRFYITSNETCEPCNSNCLTCSGPSENQCLSCGSGQKLIQGECIVENSTNICHDSCEYCVDSSEQGCTSCKNSLFYLENHPKQGSCLSFCPKGYIKVNANNRTICQKCPAGFYIISNETCEPCNDNCLTCSGPSEDKCLSCRSDQTLTQGKCVDKNTSSVICHDSCEYCVNSSEKDCITCKSNLFFIENQQGQGYCTPECPIGFLSIDVNNQSRCQRTKNLKVNVENTLDATKFLIRFDQDISNYFDIISSNLNISIEFSEKQLLREYNYSLLLDNSRDNILLQFTYHNDIIPLNRLHLKFSEKIFGSKEIFLLQRTHFSLYLQEHYISDSTAQRIATTSSQYIKTTSKMNNIYSLFSSSIVQSIHAIRSELIESIFNMFIFMNIYFPANFVEFAKGNMDAFESVFPNLFADIVNPSNQLQLEDNSQTINGDAKEQPVFDLYLSNKVFFRNYGSNLSFFTLMLAIIVCWEIFRLILDKIKRKMSSETFLISVSISFRWNLLINEFISSYQEATFFALLGLKYSENVLDLLGSALIFSFAIIMIIFCYLLNRKVFSQYRQSVHSEISTNEENNLFKRFKVLHSFLDPKKLINLMFFNILMIRSLGFSFMLIFATHIPLLQLTYIFLTTSATIFYLVKQSPIKGRFQSIITVLYEIMLLISVIGAASLHLYNQNHIEDIETRSKMGLILIFASVGMTLLNFSGSAFECYEISKMLLKKFRIRRTPSKKGPELEVQQSRPALLSSCRNTLIYGSILEKGSKAALSSVKLDINCDSTIDAEAINLKNNLRTYQDSARQIENKRFDNLNIEESNILQKRLSLIQSRRNLNRKKLERIEDSSCLGGEKTSERASLNQKNSWVKDQTKNSVEKTTFTIVESIIVGDSLPNAFSQNRRKRRKSSSLNLN